MTVVASVDDVQMFVEDRLIARHRRHSGRERLLMIQSTIWRSWIASLVPSTTSVLRLIGDSPSA